jgi:hypothetical protein
MKRFLMIVAVAAGLGAVYGGPAHAQAFDVLTQHNDIHRSGVYASETALRPATVNTRSLRMAFARRVVGQIWGQPLYVRGVPVNGQPRNIVYVATSENIVYGFDADDRTFDETTRPLMSASLGAPTEIDGDFFHTIRPSNGITGTPVIDLGSPPDAAKGTLYVAAKLKQDGKFHIFALDLTSLAVRISPGGQPLNVVVAATAPGQGSSRISFDGSDHMNRPALLISGGRLIVAFGSGPKNDEDCASYHGWVMSYSLPGLVQTGVFVTTPTTSTGMGGIWQAGNGPAADDQGNVYVLTGNGHFQSTRGLPDLANAFVKLSNAGAGGLQLADWYAPPSRDVLEACDLDLGSSGPAVIQDAGKVIGAGKSGVLYVLDKDRMGKTDTALASPGAWRGSPDCTIGQCFRVAKNQFEPTDKTQLACNVSGPSQGCTGFRGSNWNDVLDSYPHVHGSPVAWGVGNKNYNLYVWPEQDHLQAYRFDGQKFSSTPIGTSTVLAARASMPGALLSLSWDGASTGTGILWATRPDPDARQPAVGAPFISVFNDQQHFVFRTPDGSVWDSYFRRSDNTWHLQQVNFTGLSAAAPPFVSVFGSADQQHFAYLDNAGAIQDAFYRRTDNTWQSQQIAMNSHAPAVSLFVSAFHDQQHFVWRDRAGAIWDSFFVQTDNRWHFQAINTHDHPAASGPFVSVFDAADQQHFAYTDASGNVWDSFYRRGENRWDFQQISTSTHPAVAGVTVSAFHDQQHFVWRDRAGAIWDAFFSQSDGHWHSQQINTSTHPAATGPFVSVFDAADQQHFAYTDGAGNVWDSFYRRGDNRWDYQQIDTHAHPAVPVGGVVVSAFFDQQHFAWADSAGTIWDSFFSQADNRWHFQQINATFDCMSASGSDLTPNGAPCNAINKNVRGFLEAFDATPRTNGQLVEIWNTKAEHGEGVWFAKQSPPTIADGKVFLVGFPPPVPGQDWNAARAFGRLIVYTLPAR